MSRTIKTMVTVEFRCNKEGCIETRSVSGDTELQTERIIADIYKWKLTPTTDRCWIHWKVCPTCKGQPPIHEDEDGAECLCNGSYHEVDLPQCKTCDGRLWLEVETA